MSWYGYDKPETDAAGTGSVPVEPVQPVPPVSPGGSGTGTEAPDAPLDEVRVWLSRFVVTMHEHDLDLLVLWAVHTHMAFETYTTPRLILDSPVPGSGKTTVLEHLERLTHHAVQMASLSSPALLTRMLDAGPRTILIDEADRSLDPKKDGVAELLAVLNSGYKRGGSRPVLVPSKEGGWQAKEMPTYAPVVMAGNNPALPEDTRSRCIRVLLMPDIDGTAEDSDWEEFDSEARALGDHVRSWANYVRDDVRSTKPALPEGIRGRNREKWAPLKRVACAAGGRWPHVVDELALHDKEQQEMDREDGLITQRPHVALVAHLHALWPANSTFVATADLITELVLEHPDMWGENSSFGKALTAQRLGRMLATAYGVNSTRLSGTGPRGYTRASLERAWRRMGVTVPDGPDNTPQGDTSIPQGGIEIESEPVRSEPLQETGITGSTGSTGTRSPAPQGTRCPSCGGPISTDRAVLDLDCLDCYRRSA